jgi:glycosyltransferase 2 family protein
VRTVVVLGTNLVVGAAALGWALVRFGAPALALLGREPHVGMLTGLVLAVATTFLCYALRWRVLLRGLGVRRTFARLAAYRAAGQSVSTLVPSAKLGGEPVRAYLLARSGVPVPATIATIALDRAFEMAAAIPFTCAYAALLLQLGLPELHGAFVSVLAGATALVAGITIGARRLRRRSGVVTAIARSTGLDRLRVVQGRMDVLATAEDAAARLVAQRGRVLGAFGIGIVGNLVVIVEYYLLLSAFGLPASPLAVVAAIFAAGAAHSLPVPAAVGVLEGAQMFIFGALGHPPELGLAVGLATRLRELLWVLPGIVVLMVHGVASGFGRRGDAELARATAADRRREEARVERA